MNNLFPLTFRLDTSQINQLESEKSNLNTELGVAYNKFSAWDSRQIVQALISSFSQTIQAQSSLRFPYAWSRLRKHLLKHCGINLESRRTISGQTRRPYIDFVRENEWDVVMQEAYVLAKDAGVDIVRCVGKTNAKMLESIPASVSHGLEASRCVPEGSVGV